MKGNPNIAKYGKRFQKNISGNPNGRPPAPISKLLRELGEKSNIECEITYVDSNGEKVTQKIGTQAKGKSINHAIAAMMLDKALSGDIAFLKEVLNRQEGAPQQKIEHTEVPINVAELSDEELNELRNQRASGK